MPLAPVAWAGPSREIRWPVKLALAVLDIFEHENLLAQRQQVGDQFQRRAREWQKRWPIVGDVRGLGAMQAIELVQLQRNSPAGAGGNQADHEILLRAWTDYNYGGLYGNVIRVAGSAGGD